MSRIGLAEAGDTFKSTDLAHDAEIPHQSFLFHLREGRRIRISDHPTFRRGKREFGEVQWADEPFIAPSGKTCIRQVALLSFDQVSAIFEPRYFGKMPNTDAVNRLREKFKQQPRGKSPDAPTEFTGEEKPGAVYSITERRQVNDLPGKTPEGGYVYCVEIGGGLAKLGKTLNPRQRIGNHHKDAHRYGSSPKRVWLSAPHKGYSETESRMMQAAKKEFEKRGAGESFKGKQILEFVSEWWKIGTYQKDDHEESRTADALYPIWMRDLGEREGREPIARLLDESPEIEPFLKLFFGDQDPHAIADYLTSASGDSANTFNLYKFISEHPLIDPIDSEEFTYLDVLERLLMSSVRSAKLRIKLELLEDGRTDFLKPLLKETSERMVQEIETEVQP